MQSILQWKQEPESPSSYEEVTLLNETFYQNDLDEIKLEDNFEICESKAAVASQILENIDKLVDLDELIKEESSFILDEKILPLFDDLEAPRGAVAVPVPLKQHDYYQNATEDNRSLFNEIEKVYFELNHGTLTPPQSPPSDQPVIATLESPLLGATAYNQHLATVKDATAYYTGSIDSNCSKQGIPDGLNYGGVVPIQNDDSIAIGNYTAVQTPQPDIAHELAVVDELVRTRVENMQWNSAPSSPESSSSSSTSSSCNNSIFGDCSSEDQEWVPEPIKNYNVSHNQNVSKSKTSRKRNKPYSKTPDDKKFRKKEQNKNAATRYRLKKKAEIEEILNEEKILLDRNDDLTTQITDVQREIKYLKGLMRDLFKAKGFIK